MKKWVRKTGYVVDTICFPNVEIMKTERGWWKDRAKLDRFIGATQADKNLKTACAEAGITRKEWRHFVNVHPSFPHLRRNCKWVIAHKAHNITSIFDLPPPKISKQKLAIFKKRFQEHEEEEARIRREKKIQKLRQPLPPLDIVIITAPCDHCRENVKIATAGNAHDDTRFGPEYFSKYEINTAKKHGAHLQRVLATDNIQKPHWANVCWRCQKVIDLPTRIWKYNCDAMFGLYEYERIH